MSTKTRTRRTSKKPDAWKPAFLDALAEGRSVADACEAVGIGRRTAYDHRQRDEGFALAWHDADERGIEELESEARKRALDGSDTMLIFLLKAKRPTVYRENVKVEHSGSVKHDLNGMSDGELDALEARLA